MATTKRPFADLLPPLSTEQFDALKADIKAHGVRQPIDVDEDGNILDGHHRFKIDKDAPRKVVRGLSEPEKQAHAIRVNIARRNMSADQEKALDPKRREIAKALKAEGMSQPQIGVLLGVSQPAVSYWLAKSGPNISAYNMSAFDCRQKIPAEKHTEVAERVQSGEKIDKVAGDYRISERHIRRIASKEEKQQAAETERKKAVKKLGGETLGIHHGDFRKLGKIVKDNSVDLIFTDPPYDEGSVGLYGDLAEFAARTLKPGGWCLAYSGGFHLLTAMQNMSEHLTYGWMFAITHDQGDLRIRNLKIRNHWKPILGFYRPPLKAWWGWIVDVPPGVLDKEDHPWQQPVGHAAHFIEAMCPKGGVVADCCAGSGTTGVAAIQLKRQFVGFEIDKKHAETARIKLAETVKG